MRGSLNNPGLADSQSFRILASVREGLGVWLFLYLAVVVLPAAIVYRQLSEAATEEFDTRLRTVAQGLEARTILVREQTSPGAVLQTLIGRHLNRQPASLKRFVAHLEKRFPGAFRWVAWDEAGNLFDLPSAAALPGKKRWEQVTRRLFAAGANTSQQTLAERTRTMAMLQTLIGPMIRAVDVRNSQESPVYGEWLGHPCLVYLTNYSPPPRTRRRQARQRAASPARPRPYGHAVWHPPDHPP